MKKIEKYEQIYVNFTWVFLALATAHIILIDFVYSADYKEITAGVIYKLGFIVAAAILNYIKLKVVNKGLFSNQRVYLAFRALETLMVSVAVDFAEFKNWIYITLAFLVVLTAWSKGRKISFYLVLYSLLINLVFYGIREYFYIYGNSYSDSKVEPETFLQILFFYIILFLFSSLCGRIYQDYIENEQQNKNLFIELADKYDQLAAAQEDVKVHNDKLKVTNSKLEDTNKKLRDSIAEFYTLQQITQAISSIFDVKELLKHVNDIIIGVMGVSNSTIILYDEKKDLLKVHTTNVSNRNELIALNDNINCELFKDILKSGEPLLENFVDSEEYPFTQEREVNSLICVPLVTKARNFGLVLIEHKYFNAFDDDNLRLLNIIGQQVGIAMENAELYQRMHELATIDSLTGVYNRLYFQERLQQEFESARNNNYELSLAIFDIDHFKRFNDTFGHLFGDKVLKHITDLLKGSLRSGDIIARFGGEEFVLLFARTGLKEAYEKVESLRELIAKTTIRDELVASSVTVSFGLSAYPEISNSESDLLRTADNALYEAKESGRNCVRIASS